MMIRRLIGLAALVALLATLPAFGHGVPDAQLARLIGGGPFDYMLWLATGPARALLRAIWNDPVAVIQALQAG